MIPILMRPVPDKPNLSIKTGDAILTGPYPKSFTEFIGQYTARVQLMAAIRSAQMRKVPMDHMLLASGFPGVGKTSLARLSAYTYGGGFLELGGVIDVADAVRAVSQMRDGDVLFLDEIHLLVSRGKARAEWLLTLMQDRAINTPRGIVNAPGLTIIGATTDAQKLPEPILDRFLVKPVLEPYTDNEAVEIAVGTAKRLGYGGMKELPMPHGDEWLVKVARAADNNPRRIYQLLCNVRDAALGSDLSNYDPMAGYDIGVVLEWNGLTEDGLTAVQQDYLVALHVSNGRAGLATLKAILNENELGHSEKGLIQRGLVVVAGQGRELTDAGRVRAQEIAVEHMTKARARTSMGAL